MKFIGMIDRKHALLASLIASGLALSGCMSSPTYGTDKTASEQLVGDVTGILSLGPERKEPIEYRPRPELVKPVAGATQSLPAPQENVASAENPNWPESPEQRRARVRADATENRDKPGWRPEVAVDVTAPSSAPDKAPGVSERATDSGINRAGDKRQQREDFNQRLAENRQGSSAKRKYLSEPPLDYRQPSDAAPVGDVGEDELKKERRLKAAARKAGDKSWRDFLPF